MRNNWGTSRRDFLHYCTGGVLGYFPYSNANDSVPAEPRATHQCMRRSKIRDSSRSRPPSCSDWNTRYQCFRRCDACRTSMTSQSASMGFSSRMAGTKACCFLRSHWSSTGTPRTFIAAVATKWPSAGFRRRLRLLDRSERSPVYEQVYNNWKNSNPITAKSMLNITHDDDKRHFGLQGADMIASAVNRVYRSHLKDGTIPDEYPLGEAIWRISRIDENYLLAMLGHQSHRRSEETLF